MSRRSSKGARAGAIAAGFSAVVAWLGTSVPWAAAAPVNPVADPSFETPVVASGGLQNFNTGQALGAWTVVGVSGDVALLNKKFTYAGYTFEAKSGSQSLDLTGDTETQTGVEQSIATVKGTAYTLSFFVGNVVGGGIIGTSSTDVVSIDGRQVASETNAAGKGKTKVTWKKYTIKFTAKSAATTIQFLNGDPSSDSANLLDAVAVS